MQLAHRRGLGHHSCLIRFLERSDSRKGRDQINDSSPSNPSLPTRVVTTRILGLAGSPHPQSGDGSRRIRSQFLPPVLQASAATNAHPPAPSHAIRRDPWAHSLFFTHTAQRTHKLPLHRSKNCGLAGNGQMGLHPPHGNGPACSTPNQLEENESRPQAHCSLNCPQCSSSWPARERRSYSKTPFSTRIRGPLIFALSPCPKGPQIEVASRRNPGPKST